MARDVHQGAADALQVSEADRAEMIPSGTQLLYKNRIGWAHDRLKRAGLSSSPRRGFWQITPEGAALTAKHPTKLPSAIVESLIREFNDVRLRPATESEGVTPPAADLDILTTLSPDERLDQAVSELRLSVVAEVQDQLLRVSPDFFETIVLDVLHQLGYGTSRNDLKRVGRAGDGGIDGYGAPQCQDKKSPNLRCKAASKLSRSDNACAESNWL